MRNTRIRNPVSECAKSKSTILKATAMTRQSPYTLMPFLFLRNPNKIIPSARSVMSMLGMKGSQSSEIRNTHAKVTAI